MKNIVLRTARTDDAEALLGIYRFYVENTAITYEWTVPTVEEFKNRIENTLKKFPYVVAEADGKICGYAYASEFKSREAYKWSIETSIYVQKDMKKSGIGKKLLLELEDQLKRQGILNSNACIAKPEVEDEYLTFDSIRFHEKMGYKLVGEFHKCAKKFDRWYNMVWMEKFLGEHN